MRKFGALLLALLFALPMPPALAAGKKEPKLVLMMLAAGETAQIEQQADTWESGHPDIATVSDGGLVSALAEGYTLILGRNAKGEVAVRCEVQVGEKPVPEEVLPVIEQAIAAWAAADNAAFPKYNLYTQWFNPAAKNGFGWCGAFVGYYFDEAGIEMNPEYRAKSAPPLEDGSLFAVRQASQTKLYEGFQSRNRLSHIPRPGYYIIYGRRGSTPYTHVGLVTAAEYLGEGVYALETVEGNLNARIRRYRYLYDSLAERKDRNISAIPAEQQTQPELFMYKYVDNFYINVFGQTWY